MMLLLRLTDSSAMVGAPTLTEAFNKRADMGARIRT